MNQASAVRIQDFSLWSRMENERMPLSFDLELTARCNFNCRHCYINLPVNDRAAQDRELSLAEISDIADQAVALGSVWCLLTGGEPLLREDFADVYMLLKRKGLFVSVFTNAATIRPEHVALFKRYPPRDLEVTVYGASSEVYDRVTRRPGSFATFSNGLEALIAAGVRVRLKAMALRSNVHELPEIARFCRARTKDYFRFDPLLHLRFDGNPRRNIEILAERLTPDEIVAIERADGDRFAAMESGCADLILHEEGHLGCDHLFHCGAGNGSFCVSYDGIFRLCSSLWHPDCVCDLRKTSLAEAWRQGVPKVRDMRSRRREFLEKCRVCSIVNLCLWCPAHSHLETGEMDSWVDYFCRVAHARARALGHDSRSEQTIRKE